MKSWRPKDWKNPHTEHLLDLDMLGNPSIVNKVRWGEFEAGADAIVRAELENVDTIHVAKGERSETPSMIVAGSWVFIPDGVNA